MAPDGTFGIRLLRLANAIAECDALDSDTQLRWLDQLKLIAHAHSDDMHSVLNQLDGLWSQVKL